LPRRYTLSSEINGEDMYRHLKSLKWISLFCFILIFIGNVFPQQQSFEKHVFVYKNVNGHEIKANIFLPITKQKLPVVVYFHGGGFIFGNRDEGLEDVLRDKLLANNYAIVSADYRLAPETKLAEILNDVRDAVIWLRENGTKQFPIDGNKIAVAGGSAAGYLALSTGYNLTPPPKAIIAISTPTGFSNENIQKGDESILKQPGPYDIVKNTIVSYGDYSTRMELWRFLARNRLALSEIFGFDVSQDTERLQNYTLTKHIQSGYPPTLLIHAKNDHLVELSQAEKLNDFLKGKNVESELFVVENGHGSELINNNPKAVEKFIQFLDTHLK
jgi:acetyl esterase/lipase